MKSHWFELMASEHWFWRNIKRSFQNKISKLIAGVIVVVFIAVIVLIVLAVT